MKFENRYNHIIIVFKTYLLGIFFFTIFRVINLIVQHSKLELISDKEINEVLFNSFMMGWRFDTVISAYILAIPFLLLLLNEYFLKSKVITRAVKYYVLIFYSIAFFICAFDIPFFDYFFDRINSSVFLWVDNADFAFSMVFQEWKYIWPLIPLVIFIILFSVLVQKIFSNNLEVAQSSKQNILLLVILNLLFAIGLFYGIRGRLETKSPIRIGTAYFSKYPFPNKLALNPVFTLLKSYLNSLKQEYRDIQLIESELALVNSKSYLNIHNDESKTLNRRVEATDTINSLNYNVVLVIMESMTSVKMNYFNGGKNLTPTLDSLVNHSYFFKNIYSSGIHTFNGIHSTLYSYPAVFRKQPLNTVPIKKYYGLPSVLREHGYHNMYFTTHDEQFDNVGGFLLANDFDEIISAKDYPSDKLMSTLGVTDDYLFKNGIKKINRIAEKGPFLATFMTSSDHGPYYVPPEYETVFTDVKEKAVNYADWSIGEFLKNAEKQTWYDNTIFVLVADHGQALDVTYDMPINYNHIPLFIFGKNLETNYEVKSNIGGQIDLFPTIMGILNLSYDNTTFGVDLLKEERPFMYFNGDNKFGVINDEYFYIWRQTGLESLYRYKDKSLIDYKDSLPTLTKKMSIYGKSFIQTAQYLQKNSLTNSLN